MPASSTLSSSGLWWENSFSIAANDAYVHTWLFCSVIGLPGEEDWPRDVALPRQAFHSKSPQPIEKFVTDIDEQGKDLLLVSSRSAELVCTVLMRDVTCPLGGLVGGGRGINVASCTTATQSKRPQPLSSFHFHTCSSWWLLILERLHFLQKEKESDPHAFNPPSLNVHLNAAQKPLDSSRHMLPISIERAMLIESTSLKIRTCVLLEI